LPEFHLTAWDPDHADFLPSTYESASYLAKYQQLARELNINIVPGTICESHPVTPKDDANSDVREELRNMAHFLAAGTGDILNSYQKKNLWHPERPHLTSSGHSPHVAFDTPLKHADGRPVRAGMLICWDLAFPEAFRALIADGADLILIPSFWYLTDAGEEGAALNPDAEKIFLESTTISRAFENTAAIAFCNAGGMSCVAMPIQGALGQIDVGEERLEIVPVDLDVLRMAEENYKIRKDLQGELWHYGHTLRR
jgi:predicted amidohydrolase